jgi:urease accessory protein UreF
MMRLFLVLLTLLFSLSGSAMGEYSGFGQSSLAAKTTAGAADDLAGAARAALGKGPNAVPGAPLTELQRRALLQNQADTLANIERAQANSALSEALRERMVRLGQERLKTIEDVLKSGVSAPKN